MVALSTLDVPPLKSDSYLDSCSGLVSAGFWVGAGVGVLVGFTTGVSDGDTAGVLVGTRVGFGVSPLLSSDGRVSGLFQAGRCNRDGSVVPFAALYCMSCYSKFLIKCLYRDFKLHSGFGFTV